VRSVHLFDPGGAGWVAGAALRAIQMRASEGSREACVLVGGDRAERDARAYGVRWDARVALPTGRAWMGWRRVRAELRGAGRPDRMRVWSDGTERLARLAFPDAVVVREMRGGSVSAAADAAQYAGRTRASFLARWRLPPSTSLVGVLADADGSVPCADVSFLLGVLTLAGWPATAVVWRGSAHGVERAERMIRAQGRRWRIIVEDEPLPRWIGACGVGVALDASGECPASIAWGVARGTPLVVERRDAACDGTGLAGVRVVRAGVRHACAGAALDVLERLSGDAGVPVKCAVGLA